MSTQTLEHPHGVGPPPVVPPPPGATPPAWQPDASGRRGWRRKLVIGVAIVALGLGSGVAGGYAARGLEDGAAPTAVTTPVSTQAAAGSSLASVAAAATPSVVS